MILSRNVNEIVSKEEKKSLRALEDKKLGLFAL